MNLNNKYTITKKILDILSKNGLDEYHINLKIDKNFMYSVDIKFKKVQQIKGI